MQKHSHEDMWEKHGEALRNPHQLFAGSFDSSGISEKTLEYSTAPEFAALLKKLGLTLLISREYENLLLALSSDGKLSQSFFHLPHPSGIAVSKTGSVYVAATRNPNQIFEFRPTKTGFERTGAVIAKQRVLMPARSVFLAGAHYLHDLAFIGNKLYGNAVGLNTVGQIDMNKSQLTNAWWPKCAEDKKGKARSDANHIQLNSIAAGKTLASSFFSASADNITKKKPGDPTYPVDRRGVIFSGASRETAVRGLTRPHSARFWGKKLVVANSGYGEIGSIEKDTFVPRITLPGWTRGLFVHKNILFAGTSRILPRFTSYAPGVNPDEAACSVYAISLPDWKVLGHIHFPNGNQIFAIEGISSRLATGFLYETPSIAKDSERDAFLTYRV